MAGQEPPDLNELVAELERLERDERGLSALRRKLHDQIDLGFPNESAWERERHVSDKRLELHRRIDSLRAQLAPAVRRPE